MRFCEKVMEHLLGWGLSIMKPSELDSIQEIKATWVLFLWLFCKSSLYISPITIKICIRFYIVNIICYYVSEESVQYVSSCWIKLIYILKHLVYFGVDRHFGWGKRVSIQVSKSCIIFRGGFPWFPPIFL